MNALRTIAAVVGALAAIAYPFVAYFGLTHWGARSVGFLLVAAVVVRAAPKLASLDRGALLVGALPFLPSLACGAVAATTGDARLLLAQPVIVNLGLLVMFGGSLRAPMPIVERFARMQVPDLTDAERRYCRGVTKVWCVYFAMNAVVSAVLALLYPLSWWTLYTGLVAYVLAGLLFGAEFLVRKLRFRRYGAGVHDRVLSRLFPRRPGDPA